MDHAQALANLKKRGWCKGFRFHRDGRRCLLGCYAYNINSRLERELLEELAELIVLRYHERVNGVMDTYNNQLVFPHDDCQTVIACFNNHPETTEEDCITLLKELIGQVVSF